MASHDDRGHVDLAVIVQDEPERVPLLEVMNRAEALMMSTATALEVTLVLAPQRVDRALDLMREAGVELVDLTTQHQLVAQHGHAR